MNPSLLPTLQKLHEEATQGPWNQFGAHVASYGPLGANVCAVGSPRALKHVGYAPLGFSDPDSKEAYANAELIATVRTLLPEIISSLQGAEEMREAGNAIVNAIDREHIDAVYGGKVRLSGDAVRDLFCALDLLKCALAKFPPPPLNH